MMPPSGAANQHSHEDLWPVLHPQNHHIKTLQKLSGKNRTANIARLNRGKIEKIKDVNNHLKLNIDPVLSDAIMFLLVQNKEADLIQLLYNYFKEISAVSGNGHLKSQPMAVPKKKKKISSVERLFMARSITPIISQLTETAIQTKLSSSNENDVYDTFLKLLQKIIENRQQEILGSKVPAKVNSAVTEDKPIQKYISKDIVILLAGIDNAGKSTLMAVLRGNKNPSCKPSMGFCPITMKYKNTCVRFYDLGGGPMIRGIWSNYFHDAHGLIYVIDSSSSQEKMDESTKTAKTSFLGHKYIQGKPLLIISNKKDLPGARDIMTVQLSLRVPIKQNDASSARIIEASLHPQKARFGKQDPVIDQGLEWLIHSISVNFEELNQRVCDDGKKELKKIELEQAQKELRVLRSSICKSFGLEGEKREADSCLNKLDGEDFLAMELGYTNSTELPIQGSEVAQLIGYNKVALMIVASLIAPKGKNKRLRSWKEVISYIHEIRSGIRGCKIITYIT